MKLKLKRIYEAPAKDDGKRILVDRLWPRGVSKERAAIDLWLKEVAPSPALRTWFGHEPTRWEEFGERYLDELSRNAAAKELKAQVKSGQTTLLYAAHDAEHNHARVLKSFLES
jgi:uncharacterized protein YeaO (DUF488 family)